MLCACALDNSTCVVTVGLARTKYILRIYGVFGMKITKYTVTYGVYI
jgi:hypothetical protein